ncbi:hypothetical protein NEMBOFW57_004630 [Staphylotrichum longicolle]|uniref:Uncharacterized protein n=1 Tax=Staphylotrichum longicolle TaxID=669026 RepID=A0AAD4I5T8_9PEZI|nr:hypothetical protein NEMBOFW57_004630 [Staphylotrichum longicolle]
MGQDLATNLEGYNIIQESLALRTIITQTIYAGDEDDGHREFVRKTRLNRSNLGQHLVTKNGSDGTGRVSISSCYDGFLDMAFARDTCPLDRSGWRGEVVVDLADVRKIRAFQGDGPTPTVYRLFADPSSPVMRERLERKALRLGNLPSLEPYPPWEKMTHEQRPCFTVRGKTFHSTSIGVNRGKPKEHEQEDEQEDVQEDKQEDEEVGEAKGEKKDQEHREEVQENVEEDPEGGEEDQEDVEEDRENVEGEEHEHEHEHENKQEHKKEVEVEAKVEAEVVGMLEDELEDKRQDEEDEIKGERCEVLEVESEGVL